MGRPLLTGPDWFAPVLATFAHGLPRTCSEVSAPYWHDGSGHDIGSFGPDLAGSTYRIRVGAVRQRDRGAQGCDRRWVNIREAMKIRMVASVKPSHPYL